MIALACDHGAFDLKHAIMKHLDEKGLAYKDFGCYDKTSCDYPDFAGPAAKAVASGECDRGIVVCTTGIGVSITAKMEGWYSNGTEIVFACGGGIYASAVEAANIHGAKVVGVDVDQSYIDACIVTSAMKGLQNVTETILADLEAGKWDTTYGGKFITYSLSEGDYVGIPTAESSWRFNNFTMEQYEAVHAKLMSGEIVVDNNSDNVNPEIEGITVNYVD